MWSMQLRHRHEYTLSDIFGNLHMPEHDTLLCLLSFSWKSIIPAPSFSNTSSRPQRKKYIPSAGRHAYVLRLSVSPSWRASHLKRLLSVACRPCHAACEACSRAREMRGSYQLFKWATRNTFSVPRHTCGMSLVEDRLASPWKVTLASLILKECRRACPA